MTAAILDRLSAALPDLPPQVRHAAAFVLDNPGLVAVSSMRGVAAAAEVTPNTLVRMARAVGFDGYDDFRQPFREVAATAAPSFPDRARFLRSLHEGGRHGALLARMADATMANIEGLFASLDVADLKAAAALIDASRSTAVLGLGVARPLAEQFAYVASMAFRGIHVIPHVAPYSREPIDDIAAMDHRDVLLAITFSPYRAETVQAVDLALRRRVGVIALTDSRAAPIVAGARHVFVVSDDSPLPFSSTVAAMALLETLLSFMVADSTVDVVERIDTFTDARVRAGLYASDPNHAG